MRGGVRGRERKISHEDLQTINTFAINNIGKDGTVTDPVTVIDPGTTKALLENAYVIYDIFNEIQTKMVEHMMEGKDINIEQIINDTINSKKYDKYGTVSKSSLLVFFKVAFNSPAIKMLIFENNDNWRSEQEIQKVKSDIEAMRMEVAQNKAQLKGLGIDKYPDPEGIYHPHGRVLRSM